MHMYEPERGWVGVARVTMECDGVVMKPTQASLPKSAVVMCKCDVPCTMPCVCAANAPRAEKTQYNVQKKN
jgi:hypothetical protein